MTNLKLTSNFNNNILPGVGNAFLDNDKITIKTNVNSSASLLRGVNKVKLLSSLEKEQTVVGAAKLGDVYTLENADRKLIIKVESEDVKHETDLYINKDPVNESTTFFDTSAAKRKTTLTAGILILILLVVSVIFGINQKSKNEFNSKSEERLIKALSNYEKSIAEAEIDKNSSRALFLQAKTEALSLKEDGYKSEKLDKLISDISSSESDVLGELSSETKELLDLTLQINGFEGTKLVSTGRTMFVFDEKNKNVIQVDVDGKNAKVAAGKDDLESVSNIASYEDRLFAMTGDGIYEIDGTRKKVKDTDWGESLFYLYSANIYIVDKGANQIYRLAGSGSSFSDKSEWIAPGIEADFSKVKDMTIDGSIWLLSSSGKVTKFTNGNPTAILLDGITENLENPTAIYTNEDLKYTYILDKDKGRVVVLEKNGDFKIQYRSEEIKNSTDLVVSEENGKVILLNGSKLTYIDLK